VEMRFSTHLQAIFTFHEQRIDIPRT
jgi:hypothetical protein